MVILPGDHLAWPCPASREALNSCSASSMATMFWRGMPGKAGLFPQPGGRRRRHGFLAKIKHKLLGGAGMLLPPELGEKRGKKPVEDLKPVNQGVVRRAEGDEQLFAGDAGPAVVDV